MPGLHARLSPSSSKGWLKCAGRIALESAYPNLANVHSDAGTACHCVAAECLTSDGALHPVDWLGELVRVSDKGEPDRMVFFDQKLCDMTTGYVDEVRALAKDRMLMVEQQVDFTNHVFPDQGEGGERQTGTADTLIVWAPAELDGDELIVIDLKTGYTYVPVEENPQLMLYALGALNLFELSHDIKRVRLMIYQPPHGGMREWTVTIEELLAFAKVAAEAAALVDRATESYVPGVPDELAQARGFPDKQTWAQTYLHPDPNEDDCAFCRAMATCPAARAKLEATVGSAFEVITEPGDTTPVEYLTGALQTCDDSGGDVAEHLGKMMAATGFLEDWIKAVRAETERRLMLGEPVEGYGLELGRQGARAWKDPKEAERMLREQFRLKIEDAYDMTLISPTTAEKLAKVGKVTKKNPTPEKPKLTPARWAKLQALIGRSDPKPSVKPVSQITEPYSPTKPDADAFEQVDENPLY